MFCIHLINGHTHKKIALCRPTYHLVCHPFVPGIAMWDPVWSGSPAGGRCGCMASTRGKDWAGIFEKQLQKFLTMIVWRLAGMNLHCKCFLIFFLIILSAVLTMLRFVMAFPLCSVRVAQISTALGTTLYLMSRKICLTERRTCGLASLLFWYTEFEKKIIIMPAMCHILAQLK